MASVTNERLEETKIPPTTVYFNGKETPSDVGSVDGLDVLALATDEHPAHPRNWPAWKKWCVLFVLCTFQVFMCDSPEISAYYAV